jgi:dTDP-4-amino-4,6-dideoxygalactose transaminase
MQAAVLSAKLPYLDRWNARRREIAGRYTGGLDNPLVHSPAPCGAEAIAHLYVIVCEHRASLRDHLADAGVMTEIHYPVLDYRQAALADESAWPALPASEWLNDRILTLPCFPELTDEEVDFVIARINEWRPCIP